MIVWIVSRVAKYQMPEYKGFFDEASALRQQQEWEDEDWPQDEIISTIKVDIAYNDADQHVLIERVSPS